jgi:hypothetical protein
MARRWGIMSVSFVRLARLNACSFNDAPTVT